MIKQYEHYLLTNPSAAELNAILGPSWGVCHKTPYNLRLYAHCITNKEYEAAAALALKNRSDADWDLILEAAK